MLRKVQPHARTVSFRQSSSSSAKKQAGGAASTSATEIAEERAYHVRMIRTLSQHLWPDADSPNGKEMRGRTLASVGLMVASKLITIQVPFIFKDIIDEFGAAAASGQAPGLSEGASAALTAAAAEPTLAVSTVPHQPCLW